MKYDGFVVAMDILIVVRVVVAVHSILEDVLVKKISTTFDYEFII